MMIKKGQRYQWSDGQGVVEALIDGENTTTFKVVQPWPHVVIGHESVWNVGAIYGGYYKLVLLEGQEAPT